MNLGSRVQFYARMCAFLKVGHIFVRLPFNSPTQQRDVKATDSTNTGAGMKLAIKTLEECEACLSADPNEWENRIVLMTGEFC